MIRIFFIVYFATQFTCSAIKAQLSYGIQLGFNRNNIKPDIKDRMFTENESLSGYSIGIPIRFSFTEKLSIRINLEFIKKNHSIVRTDSFEGIYQSFINSYIQMPIMSEFTIGLGKMKVYLFGGGYGGYWINGKVKGAIPNIFDNREALALGGGSYSYLSINSYNEKYDFNHVKDNRIEFGYIAGCGLRYRFYKKIFFFIEGSYYRSLTDQQKIYMRNQTPRFNEMLSVSPGCMFEIR